MSIVRVISQGTGDYEGLRDYVSRGRRIVEDQEPGARAYECFANESGQVLWHEMYADADAFVQHVHNAQSSGLLEELMGIYTIDRVVALSRVTDPRVKDIVQQFGAVELHGLGGVVRSGPR